MLNELDKELEKRGLKFVRYADEVTPREEKRASYDEQYEKYKKLYKTVKELY